MHACMVYWIYVYLVIRSVLYNSIPGLFHCYILTKVAYVGCMIPSLSCQCLSTNLTIIEVPTSVNCFDRYKNEFTSGLYNVVLVLYWQQERSSLLQTWNQKALCQNFTWYYREPSLQLRRVCTDLCCLKYTVHTYSSGGTGMGVGFLDPTFLVASLTPYGAEIKINIFTVSHWLKDKNSFITCPD